MDHGAVVSTLAPDVVFRSPVVYKPYEGREAVARLLGFVMQVFEDFRYVDQIDGQGSTALIFQARVGSRELDGLDLLKFRPDGLIGELTVMVRPLSGTVALAEAMRSLVVEDDKVP